MVPTLAGELKLAHLAEGLPGLSPTAGKAHAEACIVRLVEQGHVSGIQLRVDGDFSSLSPSFGTAHDRSD